MNIIEARQVWKRYADHVVLEDLSLSVEAGEFITIIGKSGCGKTTFLKLLLGMDKPTSGTLLLDGRPLPNEPSVERGIVFQHYSVFPHLTVQENVMLGLELAASRWLGRTFGKRRRAIHAQAAAMLESVGLGTALHQYPSALSGGMRQRLALAQAMIKQPRILLLDEPFGALDPGIRAEMHQLVLDLWRQTGLTIFMVTHELKEGFYLGTRLWVFNKRPHDPRMPGRRGAAISHDVPLGEMSSEILVSIEQSMGVVRMPYPGLFPGHNPSFE